MASELAAALAKFQAALPTIAKGETAIVPGKDGKQGFKYTYADLADVSDAILPALGKLGLAFTSFPGVVDGKMCLVYSLIHVSGEERIGVWPLTGATPQQIGSAITYARRYSLMAVTGVFPGGEDDDGKAAAQAPQNGRVRTAHSDPEHTRLREPPVEDYGRTQRTRGPIPADQDRWDAPPAGPPLNVPPAVAPIPPAQAAPPVPQSAGGAHHPGPAPAGHPAGREPATGPGPARASTGQAGIIHTHFGRLGFGDDEREQRLVATAVIAGVQSVTSTKDLDEVQARRVMDTLSRCKARDALIALLAAGDKPQ